MVGGIIINNKVVYFIKNDNQAAMKFLCYVVEIGLSIMKVEGYTTHRNSNCIVVVTLVILFYI